MNNSEFTKVKKFIIEQMNRAPDKCLTETWLKQKKNIGAGNYSVSYIKCVPKSKCKYDLVVKLSLVGKKIIKKSVDNEIKILNFLNTHDKKNQFVRLFGAFNCHVRGSKYTIELMEKLGPDIVDYVRKHRPSDRWWFNTYIQIIKAIGTLEKLKINHNDIHFGNILMNKKNKICLIDFGGATSENPKLKVYAPKIRTLYGKPDKRFVLGRDIFLFSMFLLGRVHDTLVPIPQFLQEISVDIVEYWETGSEVVDAQTVLNILGVK